MFHFQSSEWILLISWLAVLLVAVIGIRRKILLKEGQVRYQKSGIAVFAIGDFLMILSLVLMFLIFRDAASDTFFLNRILNEIYLPIYGFFLLVLLALGLCVMSVGIILFVHGRKAVQAS